MAAMRSALMMLGRRSRGSSGSLAASSMAGERGLEICNQVLRPAAPPLPSLRPSSRSLEGFRRFSTEVGETKNAGGEIKNGANALHMWWQWPRNRIRNASEGDKARFKFACSALVLSSALLYMYKSLYFPGRKFIALRGRD